MCRHMDPNHWNRHMASVPKGFLRYYVLKLLAEKPLSGSEMMEKIQEQTEERWAPSPGSIYPLLSLLQDYGYIQELPRDELGRKPYQITDEGKKFLKQQEEQREQYDKTGIRLFEPFMVNHICPGLDSEKTLELRKNIRRIFHAMFDLRKQLWGKLSDEKMDQLNKTIQRIAEIIERETKRSQE